MDDLCRAQRLNRQEAAKVLGLSRGMLYFIRDGKYRVTEKTLRKLEEAEKAAGLSSDAVFDSKKIIESLTKQLSAARTDVPKTAATDNTVIVHLQFIEAREGEPKEITLTRPPSTAAAKIVVSLLADEDYLPVLKLCLPAKYANDAFLNRLTPFCVRALQEAAAILTFGLNWREVLRKPGT